MASSRGYNFCTGLNSCEPLGILTLHAQTMPSLLLTHSITTPVFQNSLGALSSWIIPTSPFFMLLILDGFLEWALRSVRRYSRSHRFHSCSIISCLWTHKLSSSVFVFLRSSEVLGFVKRRLPNKMRRSQDFWLARGTVNVRYWSGIDNSFSFCQQSAQLLWVNRRLSQWLAKTHFHNTN